MRVKLFALIFSCLIFVVLSGQLFAQTGGGSSGSGSGSGSSGSGSGSGSGYGTGSSSSGSSSTSSSSIGASSSMLSDFGTTVSEAEFQGFTDASDRPTFIGIDSGVKFIGTDDTFDATQSNATRGSTSTNRSTTRTTATRRTTTANRGVRSGSSNAITNAGRVIASAATVDSANFNNTAAIDSAIYQNRFKTRLARLPSIKIAPDQLNITLNNTPNGTTATITGNVKNNHEKKILKQLLLLEPGIDKVNDEITITNQAEN